MATRDELFCGVCRTIKPHVITDGDHVCLGCGWVNERHIAISESIEPMPEYQIFMQDFIVTYYHGVYFDEVTRYEAAEFLHLLETTGFPNPRAHSVIGACIFFIALRNKRPFVYSELVRGEMSINDLRTRIRLVASHLIERNLESRLPNNIINHKDDPLVLVMPSELVLRYCCQLGVHSSYHRSVLEATEHAERHIQFGFRIEPDLLALSVIIVKRIQHKWRWDKSIHDVARLTGQSTASLLAVIPLFLPLCQLLFGDVPPSILEDHATLVLFSGPDAFRGHVP